MTRFARILLAITLLGLVSQVALADERVEGIVRATKVTHCDATKKGGCAGALTMEHHGADKGEARTIRVPLGTPISCAGERVLLHALQGKPVVVTLAGDGSDGVAKAIQVAEAAPC